MLMPIWLLLFSFRWCRAVDLTYSIEEGKSPSTYIGNIALDSHLLDGILPSDQKLLHFSQMEHGLTGNALLFRVGKNSGKLYTAQILDVEVLCVRYKECFKMVDIAVRRRESFVKILEVKVIIKDINDNRPEFPEEKVQIEFSEESLKGARRAIPNAIDRDISPLNSQITYQLQKSEDEPFTLSVLKSVDGISKLSIVLEERLNREVQDSYIVQVIATDGGTPPRESVLHVRILVADVNDNAPVFSRSIYNVSIKYEHNVATPVVILTAKDLDSGNNGEILYHFSSQTSSLAQSLFELNEQTGEICLSSKISSGHDFEYELYVVAMDGGEPPLSSTAKVLVSIVNQQNNPPTIDVNFVSASAILRNTATISEDIAVGSFIAYVKVTDNDVGQNGDVICELHHDKFLLQSIGVKKYKITVKNPLDRETLDHYKITISCQDRGIPVLHSSNTFSLQVLDVNDMKPRFSRDTFKFSVNENQDSKCPVGVINATDPDLGAGGKLTYSLVTNNKHFLPFQIAANGSIFTVMSLDHEFQDVYEFQVLVKDNGLPPLNNTVNVIVEVRDENDNAPYFTFPSVNPYTLDVVYYPYRTSNITVLKATDSDSRENAFLKYEINAGNDKQLFTINHYSGLLSFTHVVTRQDAGIYELQFIVKDSGNPVLSATTNLSLVLTVSNRSFEMLNAVHKQIEDQIHLYLLIAIVLVAVIISVPLTAAVSMCIIRCKDRGCVTRRGRVTTSSSQLSEQRNLMFSSHETSWSDMALARKDTDTLPNSESNNRSTKSLCPADKTEARRKTSASGNKSQKGQDVIYQEIDGEERDQRRFMLTNCHNNLVSSDTDDGWSDGDAAKSKAACIDGRGYCEPCSSSSGKHKKPTHKRFPRPRERSAISRWLKTSNIGHIPDCTQWIDLRSDLYPHLGFGRFALRPSSGALCRTLEPSWNSESNPLLEPRGYTVRIPFSMTVSEFDTRHLKKAGEQIGRNIVMTATKMRIQVRKL